MKKLKNNLLQIQEDLNRSKLKLLEPEEKLEICKRISGDVTLLDSHINERDELNEAIEIKKRMMQKSGK